MIEVGADITVDRSADEVFAYLADWTNNPDWQRGMQSCTWTSDPPLQVGSTYDQQARFLGRPVVSSFEVVEYEPGTLVRIVTTSGTMPLDITRRVVATGPSTCRVQAIVRGGPTGPTRLLDPLTAMVVRRSVTGDYERLRARLEA